jgi:hypothetical protein
MDHSLQDAITKKRGPSNNQLVMTREQLILWVLSESYEYTLALKYTVFYAKECDKHSYQFNLNALILYYFSGIT